jgi:hypothetical protein
VRLLKEREKLLQLRKENNEQLPFWYHPLLHILINSLFFLLFLTFGFMALEKTSLKFSFLISIFILFWGVIEYLVHRFVLHSQKLKNFHFYIGHTHYHHQYFTNKYMNYETPIDLNRILLMPLDLLATLLINLFLSTPLFLIDREVGCAFFIAGVLHTLLYEIIHGMSHFGFDNYFTRNHLAHHDPKKMHGHFSVVIPLLDHLFKTEYSKQEKIHVHQ